MKMNETTPDAEGATPSSEDVPPEIGPIVDGRRTEKTEGPGPFASVERARVRRHRLRHAIAEVEAVVAGPSRSAMWLRRVERSLIDLRDALMAHIDEVEGPEGLLAEILAAEPRLAAHLDIMREDHSVLLKAWQGVADLLRSQGRSTAPDAGRVRRRVTVFLGDVSRHRQRGSDLVYDAYNVDIAAAD